MTTSLPRARHLRPRPDDVRPRLSRLGHPDALTGQEPPLQRAANELIAAERHLTHLQTRHLEARRSGDPPAISAAASRQAGAEDRIERLRARLHEERRRELLAARAGPPLPGAPRERPLLRRFFDI
jgi:hypothetical protein